MSPRTSTTDHNDAAAASGTGDGDAATAATPAATTTGNVDVAAAAAGNGEVTTAVAATAPARNYPAGLRVLLVDANSVCLAVIAKMLRKCLYQVTTCTTANAALEMIRNRVEWFELVLSDVYMPDMDGFKLLECIGLEMEIPVIMMSSDERTDAILKGIIHGACDYLIKPVRTEQLQTIWQHVVRKKKHELKEPEQHSRSREVREQRQKRALEQGDSSSSRCEESLHGAKRNDRDEEMAVVPADQPRVKKPRVVWTRELHERFLRAVDQLGVEKAVPKKIQELMKSPNITRENVASHLQKYRLYLKKQVKDRREKGRSNSTFANAQEVSGRTGVVRFSNQNLPQSQANLSGPVRIIGAPVGMSDIDNIGLDAHIVAFSSSMQQENNIPMDCFTGVSGNKDLRQYEHSQSMVQPYQNMPLQFGEGTSGFHSLPSSQIMGSSFPGDAIGEQLNNSLMTQQRNQFSIAHLEDNMRMNLLTQSQSRGQLVDGVGRHQSILQLTSPNTLPLDNYVSHFSGISDRNASAPTTFVGDHVNASSYDAAPPSLYVDAQNANKAASSESDHLLVDSEAFGASSFMEVNDFNTNSYLLSELDQDDTQDWRWESANFSHQLDQLRDSKSNNNFDGEN